MEKNLKFQDKVRLDDIIHFHKPTGYITCCFFFFFLLFVNFFRIFYDI